MFDHLVCMNGGNPKEDLIEHKDAELAMKPEHSAEWQDLSENHLECRTAASFCFSDGGGDELDDEGRPRILRQKCVRGVRPLQRKSGAWEVARLRL